MMNVSRAHRRRDFCEKGSATTDNGAPPQRGAPLLAQTGLRQSARRGLVSVDVVRGYATPVTHGVPVRSCPIADCPKIEVALRPGRLAAASG